MADMSDYIERLKLAIALKLPRSEIEPILAQGNLEMWESFVALAKRVDEMNAMQGKLVAELKETLETVKKWPDK